MRNNTLFVSSCRLGEAVVPMTEFEAQQLLVGAAQQSGLGSR
jgi:hypothetical protein